MEWVKVLQSSFALIFVLGLIGLVSVLIRKANSNKIAGFKITPKRIKLIETHAIDSKSKFLIVEKDRKEYFILKTENSSTLLETSEIKQEIDEENRVK